MKSVDINQSKDTGLVVALVLMVTGFCQTGNLLVLISAGMVLAAILVPVLFKPLAFVWFGLAELLSRIFSSVFLIVLYITIVLPVAAIRKMFGADAMQLKKYKSGQSAFIVRELVFSKKDLKNPF